MSISLEEEYKRKRAALAEGERRKLACTLLDAADMKRRRAQALLEEAELDRQKARQILREMKKAKKATAKGAMA